jgi:hypothetical protein
LRLGLAGGLIWEGEVLLTRFPEGIVLRFLDRLHVDRSSLLADVHRTLLTFGLYRTYVSMR